MCVRVFHMSGISLGAGKSASGFWKEVFEDIWQFSSGLEGPHQPVNGYALRVGCAWWLVDPPADLTADTLRARVGCDRVAQVLITHWQSEHVAGILNFPEARVLVSAGDAVLARGTQHLLGMVTPWEEPWDWTTRGNYPGHLAGAVNERTLETPIMAEPLLKRGWLSEDLGILSTPGHGKHAVSILFKRREGVLAFCGDLVCGDGRLWNWFDCDWDYGLEAGQRALRESALRLLRCGAKALLPAHGGILRNPEAVLRRLVRRLDGVLSHPPKRSRPINRPDIPSPAPGFRQLTPHIFQYRTGNTAILKADSGVAVVIDDGLCLWKPPAARHAEHDAIFQDAKRALGITRIAWLIPTHYHGDHIDGMSRLARSEGARIIALSSMSGPLESPENFCLACPLSWYGTGESRLAIDKQVPEGFQLTWEGPTLEFFHLGGQTWFHLGLQARVDGLNVLFVGDAWWGTATNPSPVLCWNRAEPASQGWVFALDRMIERAPDLLVCGHGSAIHNPLPLLRTARKKWQLRLERFRTLNPHNSPTRFFNPKTDGF